MGLMKLGLKIDGYFINPEGNLKVEFCQIHQIAPHCPPAVHSVFGLQKTQMFVHSSGSVHGKQT